MQKTVVIRRYYSALTAAYGPLHWWPARTRFEVIVGAFLTQNTAWRNVEYALANLRRARALNLAGIRHSKLQDLQTLIRPAGFFRQKAQRLKAFVEFLDQNYRGSLHRMFKQPTLQLRQELLSLNGVGPETADSILLYAGKHPVFVVDAYTRRILERHGIVPFTAGYEEIRELFEKSLRKVEDSVAAFNQAHALIVQVGKNHCRNRANCRGCPLERFLPPTTSRAIE